MELLPKTRVELRVRVRLGRNALDEIMAEDQPKEQLPSPLLLAFAPMHRTAMGAAFGVVLGGLLFLMTMALVVKGGYPVGPTLSLLGQFFFGYTVTFPGAFVGLFWGWSVGFLLGWGFAVVRNLIVWSWLVLIRSRAEMEEYGDFLDHM
ncbi:MAG: hypothetical protein M1453_09150 [Acidobacteria bacterium]|nr:hypothetical protein [Acidobacteriota bacterium]MCL5288142.1 hypothetical protein [Acidobacteriota bacterium]